MIPHNFTITTERLLLKQVAEEDVPFVFEATRYKGFNDGMMWDPPASEEEILPHVVSSRKAWVSGEGFSFSAWSILNPGKLVARITIRKTEEEKVYDIGYWTHPIHQGKGYITEAAQAILAFGFNTLDASEIGARFATWNVASGRVLEKIGMTRVGYIEQGFKKQGKWVPEYKMSITRAAWSG